MAINDITILKIKDDHFYFEYQNDNIESVQNQKVEITKFLDEAVDALMRKPVHFQAKSLNNEKLMIQVETNA